MNLLALFYIETFSLNISFQVATNLRLINFFLIILLKSPKLIMQILIKCNIHNDALFYQICSSDSAQNGSVEIYPNEDKISKTFLLLNQAKSMAVIYAMILLFQMKFIL